VKAITRIIRRRGKNLNENNKGEQDVQIAIF